MRVDSYVTCCLIPILIIITYHQLTPYKYLVEMRWRGCLGAWVEGESLSFPRIRIRIHNRKFAFLSHTSTYIHKFGVTLLTTAPLNTRQGKATFRPRSTRGEDPLGSGRGRGDKREVGDGAGAHSQVTTLINTKKNAAPRRETQKVTEERGRRKAVNTKLSDVRVEKNCEHRITR
jgi:hypothetical protein